MPSLERVPFGTRRAGFAGVGIVLLIVWVVTIIVYGPSWATFLGAASTVCLVAAQVVTWREEVRKTRI